MGGKAVEASLRPNESAGLDVEMEEACSWPNGRVSLGGGLKEACSWPNGRVGLGGEAEQDRSKSKASLKEQNLLKAATYCDKMTA